jgi:hypothetical protein
LGLKCAALAAFFVSLCGLIFEIVPLGEVASPALFAMKVGGVILATNALGAYLYWRGARRVLNLATEGGRENVRV